MRRHVLLLFLATTLSAAAQDAVTFVDTNAENLFRYSRMAVTRGGGAFAALRTLRLKGHTLLQMPDKSMANGTVDIKILLPDHYLRVDAVGSSERLAGYAGKDVLSAIRDGGHVTLPPESLTAQILKSERVRLARLLLGATTYVGSDVALRFQSGGGIVEMVDPRESGRSGVPTNRAKMTMPTGGADQFSADVIGENFRGRFIVDGTTRLPAQIVYAAADSSPVTMTFGDRRDVSGYALPFRISIVQGSQTIEDLVFDEILVNPEMGKRDFRR